MPNSIKITVLICDWHTKQKILKLLVNLTFQITCLGISLGYCWSQISHLNTLFRSAKKSMTKKFLSIFSFCLFQSCIYKKSPLFSTFSVWPYWLTAVKKGHKTHLLCLCEGEGGKLSRLRWMKRWWGLIKSSTSTVGNLAMIFKLDVNLDGFTTRSNFFQFTDWTFLAIESKLGTL